MKQRAIQFTKYINKVFKFNQFLKSLSDGRINPSVSMQDMLAVIFLGIVTRKGSFNQIEESQKQGYFNKALNKKLLRGSAETYGNILKTSEVGEYIEYNNEIIRKARHNKALKGGTIDGFTVVALDGTELTRTESEHRSCSCCKSTECLREDGTKIIQKHENFVGASYIGKPPNLILGIERILPGEGETTVALRLLDKIRYSHYYYADAVALDSLYASSKVINKLLDHNIIGVIRIKQENYSLVKDAEGLFSQREPDLEKKRISIKSDWYDDDKSGRKYDYAVKIWDAEDITTWDKVKKPLRVLKVEETRIDRLGNTLNGSQVTYIITTASKKEMPPETVWRILHRRWDIENKTFHDLKKYWSFGHDYHHEESAFLVMRWLIVIAVNLFMLFGFRCLSGYTKQYTLKSLVNAIAVALYADTIPLLDDG